VNEPVEDEDTTPGRSALLTRKAQAMHRLDPASTRVRQMMSKYSLIKQFLEPPFLIEYATKAGAAEATPEETEAQEEAEARTKPQRCRPRPSSSPRRACFA